MSNKDVCIVLDNIRYKNNIGPILRVAYAFEIKKVFICRRNKEELKPDQLLILRKISRGASDFVNWELKQDSIELVKSLKEKGLYIVSVDIRSSLLLSQSEVRFQYPLALVFGHEGHGVDPEIIKLSDMIIKIPMIGEGNSINVGSSVAIVAYKIRELED
ncbi:MAG: TrmH family RNA methyltransferase [Cyanobacteriota bacterium]